MPTYFSGVDDLNTFLLKVLARITHLRKTKSNVGYNFSGVI